MNSEERMRDLLSILPAAGEIAERAARARSRTLARLDLRPRPPLARLLVPGLSLMVVLAAVGLWWVQLESRAPATVSQPGRLEMHFVLSDGTRVHWIFDDNFRM